MRQGHDALGVQVVTQHIAQRPSRELHGSASGSHPLMLHVPHLHLERDKDHPASRSSCTVLGNLVLGTSDAAPSSVEADLRRHTEERLRCGEITALMVHLAPEPRNSEELSWTLRGITQQVVANYMRVRALSVGVASTI